MRTVAKRSRRLRASKRKRSSAPLETINWDTRIEFPPSQEDRVMRVRFVEVPAPRFTSRLDPLD